MASNWGQHITLARNGAKTSQQSIAVTLIKLSAVVKFKVQSPARYMDKDSKREGERTSKFKHLRTQKKTQSRLGKNLITLG